MPRIRSKRGAVYTNAERGDLVARFSTAWTMSAAARDSGDTDLADRQRREAIDIAHDYQEATPIVSLSRSPFTAAVFESSLDIFGLDGMWWAYEYDFRPFVEPIPSFFAWTGSMKLDGAVPDVPFKSLLGPEVPFVLPRILDHPDVRAVVSSVLVGEHIGFPVVYFADPQPPDLERVDDWGHSHYSFERADGSTASAHAVEYDYDKDFELGPWLDNGKLSWIAPGDIDLTLRTGRSDCPFLDLEGERRRQYLQAGERWFAREVRFPTAGP